MCIKKLQDYPKRIMIEVVKPENIAKYVIYSILALIISVIFQYQISPHPNIKVAFDCSIGDTCRIRINNEGSKATENLQMRVLYNGGCILGIDSAERQYMNYTKQDFLGPYDDLPYSKKWIVSGVEINPGVEVSFFCQKSSQFQIRISGSNLKEIVKSHNP